MSSRAATARQLIARTGDHPVITLNFDLDPEEFATAPARASQARALIDEAHRLAEGDDSLDHADRSALKADLARLRDYLASDDLPVSGAHALVIFCSGQDDLFETVALPRPTASSALVDRLAHVEPLVVQGEDETWCTALVTSRSGDVYRGTGSQVTARRTIEDYVRGHGQGDASGEHAAVQAALLQDARVIAYDEPQDALPPARPIAALLRF